MKATRGLLSALALATLPEASVAHDHAQHVLQGQQLAAAQRLRSSAPGLTVLSGVASEVRPAHRTAVGSALEVGAEVCITGLLMDNFCIYDTKGRTLLDNPSVKTLESPELHNHFCLIDVKPCYESDFQILGPKDPQTGMHCPGFRLDEATQAIIDAVRAEAGCTPGVRCQGKSYAATIKGKIKEEGDGSDTRQGPPLLTDIQVLDRNVGCDGADTVPPLCRGAGPAPDPEPAPAPEAGPVPAPAPEPNEEPSSASVAQVCLGALVLIVSAFL